ncbi:Hint domain-containing protein [Psychromarinibacter halotolerans]|uniref:Hint domain-containing protein n=1 Tax=Psychromarinibacter halotolerans TaxID=1775175 RepID=A0ABV7GJS5_9RHOB|nr:Hint domain-containing protein [Psychromarinibacter halotolerans]MDF0595714.1 Hint domain-containing protein [Psychromarinibacter halotolerans]
MPQTFSGFYSGTFDGTDFTVSGAYTNLPITFDDLADGTFDEETAVGDNVRIASSGDTSNVFKGTVTDLGVVIEVEGNDYLFTEIQSVADTTVLTVDTTTPYTYDVTCFAAGTLIATPDGTCAVEDLKTGDMVRTADGRDVAVKWVGHTTIHKTFAPAERLTPVRFRAGSLGDNIPARDLTVTADHAMLLDGALCNASALVNGADIDFVPLAEMEERTTFYHIELDRQEILIAEGAETESYVDHVARRSFDNYGEYLALYGDEPAIAELDLPRVASARLLPASVRARIGLDGAEVAFA